MRITSILFYFPMRRLLLLFTLNHWVSWLSPPGVYHYAPLWIVVSPSVTASRNWFFVQIHTKVWSSCTDWRFWTDEHNKSQWRWKTVEDSTGNTSRFSWGDRHAMSELCWLCWWLFSGFLGYLNLAIQPKKCDICWSSALYQPGQLARQHPEHR